ncbi:MAG: hypothetical protein OEZ01_07435 [Candidatus Heimdallarchaeota archaeon]|nr:hypothetical protein [Candidatus Heimdallarchaeota archaeon]
MANYTNSSKYFSKLTYFVIIGYVILAITTLYLIITFNWARNLFTDTKLIIKINAVWFSLGIVLYGFYSIRKNIKRANLSDLDLKLDTQLLIVMAFCFFGIKQLLDLILLIDNQLSEVFILAITNTGIVLEFGGFMSGLISIYLGRKRSR